MLRLLESTPSSAVPPDQEPGSDVGATVPAPAGWKEQVEKILEGISAEEVSKVVAARCSPELYEHRMEPARVLEALLRHDPLCTGYCLEEDGTTFLGATP